MRDNWQSAADKRAGGAVRRRDVVTRSQAPPPRVSLRAAVLVVVLAATAIPVELRPLTAMMSFDVELQDALANFLGYVAVGLALRPFGIVRAALAGCAMATLAEVGQMAMMHRDASAADIVANVAGTLAGARIKWKQTISPLDFKVT